VRESFAAKLRNKSPERSAEYCRVKTLCWAFTLCRAFTRTPREYPVRFQQWFLLQEVRTNRKSVRMSVLGGTPAPREHHGRFNNSIPIQTEKRIARALFAHQCGIELQHQRECSFNSIGLHWTHIAVTQDRIPIFAAASRFLSTQASWRARSTNTGPAETYVYIWYRKLRLKNSIRSDCSRMVVQYYIFLSDCTLDFSLTSE